MRNHSPARRIKACFYRVCRLKEYAGSEIRGTAGSAPDSPFPSLDQGAKRHATEFIRVRAQDHLDVKKKLSPRQLRKSHESKVRGRRQRPDAPDFDSLTAKWLIFMGLTSKRSITD